MISRWWWGPKTAGELWHKDRNVRSFDGTCVRYTRLGSQDAPVVALCAGFLCPDTYWRYLVPRARPAFPRAVLELPARGGQGPRADSMGRRIRSPHCASRRTCRTPSRMPGSSSSRAALTPSRSSTRTRSWPSSSPSSGRARPLLKGSSPWFPPGRDREPLAPRPRSRDWSPPPAPRARWPARPGRARARRRRR